MHAPIALAAAAAIAAAACGPAASPDLVGLPPSSIPTTPPTAAAEPVDTAVVEPERALVEPPEVLVLGRPPDAAPPFDIRPLEELAPEAAAFLAARPGPATVGVVVPAQQAVYVVHPEYALPMASVAKLVVMLALLDRVEDEGRDLTPDELALLEPMITVSDNASTLALWQQLGGADAIHAYLDHIGLWGIAPDPGSWGDSRASGEAVAVLLARLAFEGLVSDEHRGLALDLLSRVVPEQRWGVTAGALDVLPQGSIVAVKDGWYPAPRGWRAGSAGIVLPSVQDEVAPVPYTIAVLTVGHETLEDAIFTIEGVAEAVHRALRGLTF